MLGDFIACVTILYSLLYAHGHTNAQRSTAIK